VAILNCSACGCDVDESALNTKGVVQHGSRIYCAECASLIMSPEEQQSQPPQQAPARVAAGAAKPRAPKIISAVRSTGGKEIVEEFKIATGAQARVAPKPAAPPAKSAPAARVVPAVPAPRVAAPAPRVAAAPPAKPQVRPKPVRPDINFSKARDDEDFPELVPLEPAKPAGKTSSTRLGQLGSLAVSPSSETAPVLPAMKKGHWPKQDRKSVV
jgi:hypothetical protein